MKRRDFAGFPVVVENAKGTIRHWHDRDGRETGSTFMKADYGFLEGHLGVDGDEVDCYLGPDESAPFVYVVHQLRAPEFEKHDEDKVILGTASEAEAKALYLAHRNDGERAYGGMTAIPLEQFRQKLERRTGSGKIRHEVTMPKKGAALRGQAIGFDYARGQDGVRVGEWDRICVPGHDFKEGTETRFDAKTMTQMVRNFGDRGDPVMIDWNHQANYSHENGRPAPALGFYGALAVVLGGKLVSAASARGVEAPAIDAAKMEDGLWGLRTEVTPQGHELLPGYRMLSPTFTPHGENRQGEDVGYQLLAVAATNTPWQSGTRINFEGVQMAFTEDHRGEGIRVGDLVGTTDGADRGDVTAVSGSSVTYTSQKTRQAITVPGRALMRMDTIAMGLLPGNKVRADDGRQGTVVDVYRDSAAGGRDVAIIKDSSGSEFRIAARELTKMDNAATSGRGAKNMNPKMLAAAVLVGMSAPTDPKQIRAAFVKKFEGEAMAAATEPKFNHAEHATHLEEMAKAYEDAHFEDDGEDGEPPHMGMRKMAAKFRALSKLEEGAADPAAGDPAAMGFPPGEPDEDDKKDKEKMQAKMDAIVATNQALAAKVARLDAAEQAREKEAQIEAEQRFEQLADHAIAGGYPKEARAALVKFARVDFEGARTSVSHLLPKHGAPAILFDRLSRAGGPVGKAGARTVPGPAKPKAVMAMGRRFIEDDADFAGEIKKLALSTDPADKAKVDALLPNAKQRVVTFERLRAAEKIVREEQPDLAEAADSAE